MAVDRTAVILTAHEILAHPAVRDAQGPVFNDGMATLEFKLDLDFGARWQAEGASPMGVLPLEPVRLDFFSSFPRTPPRPSLRADFSRNHPHIQPYLTYDDRPVPCLVDGSLAEFFAAQGAYRLIEQFRLWLRNAANGSLIDQKQGWEPMRRDNLPGDLFCNADSLREVVTPSGGFKIFEMGFNWVRPDDDKTSSFLGQTRNSTTAKIAMPWWKKIKRDRKSTEGLGGTFVVWAGRDPIVGGPAVSSDYAPDDVVDLDSLKALAARLKMADGLRAALSLIQQHAGDKVVPVPIVLAVRRPYKLLDSGSEVELCAYLLPATVSNGSLGNPKVTALSLHDEITPRLLRLITDAPVGGSWALLGCGSLGSKIAMHRARDGAAPVACGDPRGLLPHNAARHALYPRSANGSGWLGAKADLLAEAIEALGQTTAPTFGDQRDLVAALKTDNLTADWLVNTTASTIVREDLASAFSPDLPRGIEACLFDHGALGYFAVEGPAHNPDSAELMAELYTTAQDDPAIGRHMFPEDGQLATVNIGQGCGSLTMKVSDAKISSMASLMAETLSSLSPDLPQGQIDLLMRSGLGVSHQRFEVQPWRRLAIEGLNGWMLSISPRALGKIEADIGQHRKVETGGVLIGFHSMIARRIYVADVHPAPPDSVRQTHKFVLGVEGLAEARKDLAIKTRGALTFSGTWHSHLGPATPSSLDRKSAAEVGDSEPQPKAFLIYGKDGLRAISAATIAALNLTDASGSS